MVRHLIHISDLHIRTGDTNACRYEEYSGVFRNTIELVKEYADPIIIITGDIFHNKNKVEAPGIILFYEFIGSLANIAPIYIIMGNHDYRQDLHDCPDLIYALLHNRVIPNVIYMQDTGHYIVDNVGFGLVSVRDTLKAGDTSGQVDELPPFPSSDDFPENVLTKVALFHGTINNCTLQNYTKSPTGYPIQWFQGYDIALLGDVHLQQLHGKWEEGHMYWGYSGSLVQQDFGETIIDHGFFVWDLAQKSVKVVNVKNQYGMLKIKENKGIWRGLYKNKWFPLEQLLSNDYCPTNLSLRIIYSEDETHLTTLEMILKQFSVKYHITNCFVENYEAHDSDEDQPSTSKNNIDISQYSCPETWIQYIQEQGNKDTLHDVPWKEWLKDPYSLTINTSSLPTEDIKKQTETRNTTLCTKVEQFRQIRDKDTLARTSLRLSYIYWKWLLCYKNDCWFNFDELKGNVACINARNGEGKSSFLEILCWALYGEAMPSRYNKEYSGSVICQQRPSTEKSMTDIQFYRNDVLFRIKRQYSPQSQDKRKISVSGVELLVQDDNRWTKIHSGKKAVDNWVKENLGSIQNFLLSSMLTQHSDQDFFQLKSDDQLLLLDKALHLHCVNDLGDILKQANLNFKAICDSLDNMTSILDKQIDHVNFDENVFDEINKTYTQLKDNIQVFEEEYSNIQETWHHLNPDDLRTDNIDIAHSIETIQNALVSEKVLDDIQHLQQKKGLYLDKLSQVPKHYRICDSNTEVNTTELESLLPQLKDAECNVKILETSIPTKPMYTLNEYVRWKKEYTDWNDYIKNIYGDTTTLISRGAVINSTKPSTDKDQLSNYRKNIQQEQRECQEWLMMDEEIFKTKFEQISREYHEKKNDITMMKEIVEKLVESVSIKRHLWQNAEKRLFEYKKCSRKQPQRSKEECTEWLNIYKTLEAKKDVFIEALNMKRQYKKTCEDISEIETTAHPYNDDCWACRQQIWKVKLEELLKQKTIQEHKLSEYSIQECIEDLQTTLIEFKYMESQYADIVNCVGDWSLYESYTSHLTQLEEEVNHYREDWENEEFKLKQVVEKQNAVTEQYVMCENEYKRASHCAKNKERWLDMEIFIETQECLIEAYNKYSTISQDVEKLTSIEKKNEEWETCKAQLENFQSWKSNMVKAVEDYQSLQGDYYRKTYLVCSAVLKETEDLIDFHERQDRLKKELKYWQTVLEKKPFFDRKCALKRKLAMLKEEYSDLTEVYHKSISKRDSILSLKQDKELLLNLKQHFKKKKEAIEHIGNVFSGFRKWLYKTKVLPHLLREANKIVDFVTRTDSLHLAVDFGKDDTHKLSFAWFIKDGSSRLPIEKASGFQRFIIGLGVRITLSHIGASAVSCKQFFIDEGFVACDKTHLMRIPDLLQNLLGLYDSILLVSHLEEIKESTNVHISIKRDSGLSSIQYGTKMSIGKTIESIKL
jgi:DNA repair exonuclease SbcCD ATPase subunit/DNA repair exonuclease SbcCD nuclease subunit